ncbi:MAG: C40 family peptidase [Candidatus Baltobacteraceae bacterium]|jgi:D-gamma-glutamyl-meso-diaminopimelic acid endopeptidase CwlS/peptidoglycan endopeptidase LytF
MLRGPLALVAFAALASLPLAASAATTTVVGGVVVIDGADPAPSPGFHSAKHGAPAARTAPTPSEQASEQPSQESASAEAVVRYAMSFVGVPYVWAGASPSGFDCSGFTQYVFKQLGVAIPRTADAQFAAGRPVSDPLPGDLVFFQTYDWGASHVGLYLGNGYFVNAIRPDVHVSSFASDYFRGRYLGARRFLSS